MLTESTFTATAISALDQPIAQTEITAQLVRLLESHYFCHSSRYPALLKYLVEQSLLGEFALLKERILGVEVFNRPSDYDTHTDPVVRVTAAEVRKRIAQYYQEPAHQGELRIELPIGSYIPRFVRPAGLIAARDETINEGPEVSPDIAVQSLEGPAAAKASAAVETEPEKATRPKSWLHSRWLYAVLACVILAAIAVASLMYMQKSRRDHALGRFWDPVASGDAPTLFVIGEHKSGSVGNALRTSQGNPIDPSQNVLQMMNNQEQLILSDVMSLSRLTGYMVKRDRKYRLSGAGEVDIADLRNGPVVLLTGLNNRWTLRLTSHLRYRFVDNADPNSGTIEDTQSHDRSWKVDFTVPVTKMPMDYAIVARYFDPLVEQPVLIAAGIGATGTIGASEFITTERSMKELDKLLAVHPGQSNIEVVLSMPVIDGDPGPPHIIASQIW
jgi:hypothetical protein